jgi:hypothetical protein
MARVSLRVLAMRRLLKIFFAAVIASAICVRAADIPANKPATNRDEKKKLSPEERAKEAVKRREEFNKLTPEQKEAKRKEFKARLEKRVNELRCKQTNGVLSNEELRELQRRETLLKRFEQAATNAPAVGPKP